MISMFMRFTPWNIRQLSFNPRSFTATGRPIRRHPGIRTQLPGSGGSALFRPSSRAGALGGGERTSPRLVTQSNVHALRAGTPERDPDRRRGKAAPDEGDKVRLAVAAGEAGSGDGDERG
ncbi:hypothetical protein [Actinoplanes sp. HUAS TT8]|uniref:hypothetical protein n=1 Tax=Actinoplanes sp. HUAS TT8 TaxID=3447453 RepID=UPI003F51F239